MKGIILSIIVLVGIAILLFTQKPEKRKTRPVVLVKESLREKREVRNMDYQIMESDTNEFKNVVYLDVLIHEKMSKEELIEIARKEWVSHGERLYMALSFRYFSNINPNYGVASYFVDCDGCEARKKYVEPIQASIFYKESQEPETINMLPDGVDSSMVVARFYNHASGDNALIAYTNAGKTTASYLTLHKGYQPSEEKLLSQGNMVFKIIETGAKYQVLNDRVEYIHTNGNIAFTFQIAK